MKKIPALLTGLVAFLAVGTASTLKANAASAVNDYIASQNITPAKVTSSVWSGFPKYKYRNGVGKPEGVVIHETANNSSTIYNEIAYMKSNYQNAFVHSFVDASRIINIANTNYLSWGVGYPGNSRFVQFEQVRVHSKSAFAHEVANAASYTAQLLHQYGLKPNRADYDGKGTVWSHRAVAKYLGGSDHTDPVSYYSASGKKWFGQGYTMAQFYTLVKQYYNNGSDEEDAAATSLDAVTYSDMDTTTSLSGSYAKYRLYNHVKGAYASMKSYSWTSVKAKAGKTVYVNKKGVKDKQGTTWYRITFSNSSSAKNYWVYGPALNL